MRCITFYKKKKDLLCFSKIVMKKIMFFRFWSNIFKFYMNFADSKLEIQINFQQNTKINVCTFSNHLTHTVRNVCQCGRIRPTNPAESWITGLLEACPVLSHQPPPKKVVDLVVRLLGLPASGAFFVFFFFSTEEEQNPQYCSSAPSSEVVSQSIFRGAGEELRHSMRQKVVWATWHKDR